METLAAILLLPPPDVTHLHKKVITKSGLQSCMKNIKLESSVSVFLYCTNAEKF
jgi:hypothetical protein